MLRRGGVEPGALEAMARALVHRGPDGEGAQRFARFELEGDVWQAGLAHRRLAIFDPTPAGGQPMLSRSGRSALVLNGEIYNHPELRRRLPGFPWRTATDTEVLLELFEREGVSVLARANGMFAFALWDLERRRLWLGRDRLGIKPLFYREDKDGLVFASELRALLAGRSGARRIDARAVSAYFDLGFVPAPLSIMQGVAKLPPGCLLAWQEGETRLERWWQLPEAELEAPPGWRERLYARLVDAVRLQLRSDVPVGCFLSGGVDSTLIAALAMRERGALDTFSLCFPEAPAFDEARHARYAARRLGTRHHEIPVTESDALGAAPAILAGIDEPFADSSLLPVHLLSRAARASVTVALSGDGADELFAGYRRYAAERWLARWRRLPPGLRGRVIGPLVRRMPADRSTAVGELGRRMRRVIEVDGLDDDARAYALARIFSAAEAASFAPGLAVEAEAGASLFGEARVRLGGRDALDARLRLDLSIGLPDDMLTKVDRASMAYGLEVRVPYLDHALVEHAARLPSRLKRRGGRSKLALLDVFGAALPRRTRRRRKWGFEAPLTSWLRGSLRELMRDSLAETRLARSAWIAPRAVRELIDRHERGVADHAWRIWSLMVLVDWADRHGVL
jgi:asparagine synthase (glutamine-hydrolysing)